MHQKFLFVRSLKYDIKTRNDSRMACDFGLEGTAVLYLHGIGGRTVLKLGQYDFGCGFAYIP